MQHYNPSIGEDLHRIFNLKGQAPTNEVSDEVVPVVIIERNTNIVRSFDQTNSAGSGVVYTTPTDKDFYLTGGSLGVIKDATSTSTATVLIVTIDGVTRNIGVIPSITLTAQSEVVPLNILKPIKLDRGTNISLFNGTAVANIKASATIHGYTVETLKGV